MMQWVKSGTRSACLFGVLLAVLAGCNGSDSETNPESTFSGTEPSTSDDTKVPNEPVTGEVKIVPNTDPSPPVTTGGEPNPIVNALEAASKSATRFIEIAPDTAGGQTFESSPTFDYDLGNVVTMHSADSAAFTGGKVIISPIKGWIRYPEKKLDSSLDTERYKVIVFLHGQHTDSTTEHSFQGYNYLAEDLTPHGYVVLSIDARIINEAGWDNSSGQSRAQLVLGTLDRLRQIDENGQVDKDGKPGPLNDLKGKLDFTRIGVMGHSRGGQGVSTAILFNETRSGVTEADLRTALLAQPSGFRTAYPDLSAAVIPAAGSATASIDETRFKAAIAKYNIYYAAGSGNENVPPPYSFKGAFLLAQTDFGGSNGLSDVPVATLLPSCDGDMRNLQGSSTYDRNRFGRSDYTAPRYQIMVNGANHNYYNTHWPSDDFGRGRGPDYCLTSNTDSIRLTSDDQRRGGTFIINSFMRYHVGGEQKFASWWNGLAQLPEQACPSGKGPCDERIVLTVQKAESGRQLIQRFEWADSLRRSLIGGVITFSDFDATARCIMPSVANAGGNCAPTRLPGFAWKVDTFGIAIKGLLSIADHAELPWSKPNASIVTELKDLSAKDYDSLAFRIGVVWPLGQEVEVTLTDTAGKSATVDASNFSDALYNAPKRKKGGTTPKEEDLPMLDDPTDAPYANGEVKILLNMVAIPLQAFEGVDLAHLKELKLAFPKESGKVAITDIELQNFGRDERLAEIALSQAGMLGGAGGGVAFGSNEGANKSAGDEDNQLIVNH